MKEGKIMSIFLATSDPLGSGGEEQITNEIQLERQPEELKKALRFLLTNHKPELKIEVECDEDGILEVFCKDVDFRGTFILGQSKPEEIEEELKDFLC